MPDQVTTPGRLSRWPEVLTALILSLLPCALSAQEGAITGRISHATTNQPVSAAQVHLPGLGIGVLSQADGRYLLLNVPVGTHTLRAERIGYGADMVEVVVRAGETAQVDFRLEDVTLALDEIVVTGTGAPTQRRRLGQTIESVTAEELELAPVSSVADALMGRVPGISGLLGKGETGQGSNILLRGTASLSQRNDPLIYIDGVRVDNRRDAVSGVQADRLSDINPADIERIEVLKGAAAATLFGTEASSGVIQIFTKRGQAGAPTYTLSVEQSAIQMPDRFPVNAGYDPVTRTIVTDRPSDVWVGTGHQQDYNLSVRGGSPAVRYYFSGRFMSEDGPLPNNELSNASLRTSLDFAHNDRLSSQVDVSVVRRDLEAPWPTWGSNVSEMLLANPAFASEDRPHGEQDFTIRGTTEHEVREVSTNALVSAAVEYQWSDRLRSSLRAGHNYIDSRRTEFRPEGVVLSLEGFRSVVNRNTWATTIDVNTHWEASFGSRVQSTFTVGGQGFWEGRVNEEAGVAAFPSPTLGTLRGGARITGVDEARTEVINAGLFFQEQVGLDDRLFVTVGARMDGNSAFGEDFGLETYPKLGLSWVVSDHGFWSIDAIDQLRLRAALGSSGLQPGAFDAQRTWEPAAVAIGGIIEPQNLGNAELKPERSTERELGIEAGFFGGRFGIDAVYYNQTTSDALLPRSPTPSGGFVNAQLVNIGEVSSQGIEIATRTRLVQRAGLSWDLNLAYTWSDQVVEDLGGVPGFRIQGRRRWGWIEEGYRPGVVIAPVQDAADPYTLSVPLEQLTSRDQILPNTIKAADGTDSLVFMGNSLPSWTVDLGTTLQLGESVTISGLLSGAGGFIMSNENSVLRTAVGYNMLVAELDRVLDDPAGDIEARRQAVDAYGTKHPTVISSHMEKGDYLRLSEVSVAYRLPASLVQGFGLNTATVRLGGRNLLLFTGYGGLMDPGSTGPTYGEFLSNIDYLSAPTPRRFVLSISAQL